MPGYMKRKSADKTRAAAFIAIFILIIAAVIILYIKGRYMIIPANVSDSGVPGIIYDSGAVPGGWEEADLAEIVDGLNGKVEDGMINISMNTSPCFENGNAEGNLMIVNEGANRYPQVVEIIRNDTEETIYKSGAIPVGSKIESAKLNTTLSAGTYECTALFYNVDPDDGSYLGCAGAVIRITVLE